MLIAVHEPNGVRMWGTASGVHQRPLPWGLRM